VPGSPSVSSVSFKLQQSTASDSDEWVPLCDCDHIVRKTHSHARRNFNVQTRVLWSCGFSGFPCSVLCYDQLCLNDLEERERERETKPKCLIFGTLLGVVAVVLCCFFGNVCDLILWSEVVGPSKR